jgi:HSP20 family protein
MFRTPSITPVFGLRREIDRLFDDMYGSVAGRAGWIPAVDVREDDKEVTILAELPGLKQDDVEVTCDNGVLTIRGEKSEERKEGDDRRYHLVERTYGSFTRSFQLPQGVDETKIDGSFENGVLTVHIPKTALPQPKRIQISSGAASTGSRRISAEKTTEKQMTGRAASSR